MTFQLGDKVEWTVYGRGWWRKGRGGTRHAGEVVGVLPAHTPLAEVEIADSACCLLLLPADGMSTRNHESYLIHEPGKGRGKGVLRWPRVSGLRRVGA